MAWLVASVAFGIYARSANSVVLALISTIPIFAIAWIVVGFPAVAAGTFVIRMPVWIVGVFGASAGALILLVLDRDEHLYRPENLLWVPIASVSGAAGMFVYRHLIKAKPEPSH